MTTTKDPRPDVQNAIGALMTSLVTGHMIPEHLQSTRAFFLELMESEGHTWSEYDLGFTDACVRALEAGMILGGPRG